MESRHTATGSTDAALRLLQLSARLLLEYNARSKEIERRIARIARHARRRRADARGISRGHHRHDGRTRLPCTGDGVAHQRRRACGDVPCDRRAVSRSHRGRRSHEEPGSRGAPGAAAQSLDGRRALRAGGICHRLAVARRCRRHRRERALFSPCAGRAAGSGQAACPGLRAPLRRGPGWRGARRPGHPAGLDGNRGTLPDRSGADARAGPASHQRRARHAGQPHDDGHLPPGAGDGHPDRRRARRRSRRLAHPRAGDALDVAVQRPSG